MTSLLETVHNPDVLTCLANLSNDEVFTPPDLANDVLDMLPAEIWSDPTIKILDPCCKSGVFLREAAKRFIKGLEGVYPDLNERVDHIMHEQLRAHKPALPPQPLLQQVPQRQILGCRVR